MFSAQISPLPVPIVTASTSQTIGHHFDQSLTRFTRCEGDRVADHIGLAAGSGVRSFRRTRGVVVANHDVLGLHAHLVRGDLREHGENALSDLSDPGDDLSAAAVVDLGPGSGAVDHGGPRDAVPAGSHSSSALAGHRLLRRFLFLGRRKTRAQCARWPDIVTVEIATRSRRARRRRTRFPAGGLFQRVERAHQADRPKLGLWCA